MKTKFAFKVPRRKQVRMIVHADCKNEADDQYALVHHLLTPKFQVKGIIAGHFDSNPREYGKGHTAEASLEEIRKVLKLMGAKDDYPLFKGAEKPLLDENTPQLSEGCDFIIQEAMREDSCPLFIAMQGAVTDLASAILLKPEISERMTAIWIGGGAYPEGGSEFNLKNDIAAANVIMQSGMPIWQVPQNVYKQVAVSLAELQYHVRPCGAIGKYLFDQLIAFNMASGRNKDWPNGESWTLGDNPTIGVLLDEKERTDLYEIRPAPRFSYEDMRYEEVADAPEIRVYKQVNDRLILQDLFAKLAINFGE